jgi:hypothetical protein
VGSREDSNAKKQGENNAKGRNRHLAWAYVQAALLSAGAGVSVCGELSGKGWLEVLFR